jgi:hypothetical protein
MNVTPAKMLLGISLAAYGYCAYGYLFPDKIEVPKTAKKDAGTDVMDRTYTLVLAGDPFGSQGIAGGGLGPALAIEPGRQLGELNLQAIFLSGGARVAMVNGHALREGDVARARDDGPLIRALRVGEDFALVEGNGQLVTLRLHDKKDDNSESPASSGGAATLARGNETRKPPSATGGTGGTARGGTGGTGSAGHAGTGSAGRSAVAGGNWEAHR